jgi:hypothetical protein
MSKQRIEIEVDVPDGHSFSHAIMPDGRANYLHDGQEAKCCYPCVVFTKIEPNRETWFQRIRPEYTNTTSLRMENPSHNKCLRINFEDGKVVSVALEPLPAGEGS